MVCTIIEKGHPGLHTGEAGEGDWLQGEAALQAHSFRDADPRPGIPKIDSGWNGLEIAENDRTWLEMSGLGWKCI